MDKSGQFIAAGGSAYTECTLPRHLGFIRGHATALGVKKTYTPKRSTANSPPLFLYSYWVL